MKHFIGIYFTHRLMAEGLKGMIQSLDKVMILEMQPFQTAIQPSVPKNNGILILEISFPSMHLLEAVKRLKSDGYKIMIVGHMLNNCIMRQIMDAEVDAYLLKTCSGTNLLMCLEEVMNNSKYYCYSITQCLNEELRKKTTNNELTQREQDVLQGIANSKGSSQIARELNITTATVRTHRKNMMLKLGAKNYIGLIRKACSMGLLAEDDQFCEGCIKLKCLSQQMG